MDKIVKAKQGISLTDMFLIAGTKSLSEKVLIPFIGNNSLMSGGLKVLGSMLLQKSVGGKAGEIIGTALAVDGTEDIMNNVFKTFNIGGSGNGGEQVI